MLIIIHGGGYELGGTARYANHNELGAKFVRAGIVVVVLAHRLGVLGFASGGDRSFAGNYGLWDQLEALRFVRGNIREFGGDYRQITILGFSSGASSAAQLGVSPHSRGVQASTRRTFPNLALYPFWWRQL